jgi:hypothetical protein
LKIKETTLHREPEINASDIKIQKAIPLLEIREKTTTESNHKQDQPEIKATLEPTSPKQNEQLVSQEVQLNEKNTPREEHDKSKRTSLIIQGDSKIVQIKENEQRPLVSSRASVTLPPLLNKKYPKLACN